MPRYDYKCPECGNIEEKNHGALESPSFYCPEHPILRMKKLIPQEIGVKFIGQNFHKGSRR